MEVQVGCIIVQSGENTSRTELQGYFGFGRSHFIALIINLILSMLWDHIWSPKNERIAMACGPSTMHYSAGFTGFAMTLRVCYFSESFCWFHMGVTNEAAQLCC
jgi:hypothetical protein